MTTLLLVEDDEQLSTVTAAYFELHNYTVIQTNSAAGCLRLVDKHAIDLIVLDLTLPDEDGIVVLRKLRSRGATPIIVVSGRISGDDRILGFEVGADDYLCKPFLPKELLYRVNNILSRVGLNQQADQELHFHGLTLKPTDKALFNASGHEIPITRHEFQLLSALAKSPGRVFSREQLLDFFNDIEGPESNRAIDITISRLRKKIEEDVKKPKVIVTVKGLGYKMSKTLEHQG